MDIERKAMLLKSRIERACVEMGLNLTIYDGKIGFVDQENRRIVALWTPEYKMSATEGGN